MSDFLEFTLYRGADDSADAELLGFEVQSESVEGSDVNFVLKFDHPLLVSAGVIPDVLIAKIVNEEFFSSAGSGE